MNLGQIFIQIFYNTLILKIMLQKTENQFSHELFGNLTTITNEGNEVFFISNEVAKILEYSKNSNMLENLDSEDILRLSYTEAKSVLNGTDVHSSGVQLITESGLYMAVLASRKPEATQFRKWVVSEVLPAIRKTGVYYSGPTTASAPASQLDILAQAIAVLQGQDKRLSTVEQKLDAIGERLAEPEVIALLGVPNPTARQKVEAVIAGYTKTTMGDYRENWNLLYSRLYLHYRIKVKNLKKDKGQSWLDVLEQHGHCEKLLAVAEKYFRL
jgi:prophage antirepressor-like protein